MQQSSAASGGLPSAAAIHPSPAVVAQRMGDETVLVHLITNRIYELNRTGSVFWELLAAGQDREAIRTQMLRRFTVSAAALDDEIERLVAGLLANELIYSEIRA
ncbi:MAG: PqqD family protein [Chloroflexota bacterium]|nr:PqqD family protein [Chloroflexota bacterium]